MNVREIILEKIAAVGADGLCRDDCGCGGEDLFCCAEPVPPDCVLAKAVLIKDHFKGADDCQTCEASRDYCEFCIADKKIYVPLTKTKETNE